MGRLLILIGFFVFSCGTKTTTLEDYERKNPYPGESKERLEYSSRGSLLPREGYQDLYSELRANKVGDIIYIQVVESINAIESLSTQTQRSAAFQQGISSFFGVSQNTLADIGVGSGQLGSKGSGKVQQSGVLTTKLAGRVMRVYPNGTMLVEAKKYIVMNNAQREVVLRGIVRPQDIDSGNIISTDKIANLEVFIDGKGFLADGGSPGWFARILAKVLPF